MSIGNAGQWANAGLYTSIGGAAMGGVGSFFSALGQKNSLNFQAQMNDANAFHAGNAGFEQGSQVLQRGGQMMATQRANLAASGVDITDGSAAQTIASTDVMRQVDANTTVNNAMQAAFGYQAQATMERAAAKSISPISTGFTSLLDGATKVGSQWALNKNWQVNGNRQIPRTGPNG